MTEFWRYEEFPCLGAPFDILPPWPDLTSRRAALDLELVLIGLCEDRALARHVVWVWDSQCLLWNGSMAPDESFPLHLSGRYRSCLEPDVGQRKGLHYSLPDRTGLCLFALDCSPDSPDCRRHL